MRESPGRRVFYVEDDSGGADDAAAAADDDDADDAAKPRRLQRLAVVSLHRAEESCSNSA